MNIFLFILYKLVYHIFSFPKNMLLSSKYLFWARVLLIKEEDLSNRYPLYNEIWKIFSGRSDNSPIKLFALF